MLVVRQSEMLGCNNSSEPPLELALNTCSTIPNDIFGYDQTLLTTIVFILHTRVPQYHLPDILRRAIWVGVKHPQTAFYTLEF